MVNFIQHQPDQANIMMHSDKLMILFLTVIDLLQVGGNLAIIGIVANNLVSNGNCYLVDIPGSMLLCDLTYIFAGCSIGLLILVSLLRHTGGWLSRCLLTLFFLLLGSTYSVGGSLTTIKAVEMTGMTGMSGMPAMSVPYQAWRTAIFSLFWANFGLNMVLAFMTMSYTHHKNNENEDFKAEVVDGAI